MVVAASGSLSHGKLLALVKKHFRFERAKAPAPIANPALRLKDVVFSLPMHPYLTEEDQRHVAAGFGAGVVAAQVAAE